MIKRKAYSIQMNFPVPASEKKIAESAEESFDDFLSHLKLSIEYLNYLYNPLKKCSNVDLDLINQYRKTFHDYQQAVKKRYDDILKKAFHSLMLMNEFASDTVTREMMKSFEAVIKELEKLVNTFLSLFETFSEVNWKSSVISSIDAIRNKANEIHQLVNDRIYEHIDSNILAKNWANELSDQIQEKIETKVPLVRQLFEERQRALKEKV